ncbi:P-loop containing nucleoside triphosphate hydrolase protein [Mycena amicta]|nr:P-loop containing nucleoside triphosphate hydrolase protein [Mycena amicta]
MPFTPVDVLDPDKLQLARRTLCTTFNVPELYPYQEQAGQNILQGRTTILDVPTGGGKTMAFWYPLFYHWQPGRTDTESQKIILVIGPLVALLEAQANSLNSRGIPAVAITQQTPNLDQAMKDLGNNKFRVGLVGPEMAQTAEFHANVFNSIPFAHNVIELVIDELHCISEWGSDDFRPEYRSLSDIGGRLPAGTPILGATATGPDEVLDDIIDNLGIPAATPRIRVSNAKPNVSLSVRILQHEPESFADLFLLFPDDPSTPDDFPQTLIYANTRQDAEKIQDFLRDNTPDEIEAAAFEFYHRLIAEDEKISIQERIASGQLRGVSATDALGLGMDFRNIMRVLLWMKPRTFLSLVQKIGRCVRDATKRGQAVLYLTKKMYTQCCVEWSLLQQELEGSETESGEEEELDDPEPGANDEAPLDREAATEGGEDNESSGNENGQISDMRPRKRRRTTKQSQKKPSPILLRDTQYFMEYIATDGCRREVWDKFFGNKAKAPLPFPVAHGPCCDNCAPDDPEFKIDAIIRTGGHKRPRGRRPASSPELEDAVYTKLLDLREQLIEDEYPGQSFLTGKALLPDAVLDTLARRARLLTSVDDLRQETTWIHIAKYGARLISVVQDVVALYPDHAQAARDAEAAEREKRRVDAAAMDVLRPRLQKVFEACFKAVYDQMESPPPPPANPSRRKRKPQPPRRICQMFLQLPKRNRYPSYYELIKDPISMLNIQTLSKKPNHFTTIFQYRDAWHLMFDNAVEFNQPGSDIVNDANHLRVVFDRALSIWSHREDLPGHEHVAVPLPDDAEAPSSPTLPSVAELLEQTFGTDSIPVHT